jgi:hypothetical protein
MQKRGGLAVAPPVLSHLTVSYLLFLFVMNAAFDYADYNFSAMQKVIRPYGRGNAKGARQSAAGVVPETGVKP